MGEFQEKAAACLAGPSASDIVAFVREGLSCHKFLLSGELEAKLGDLDGGEACGGECMGGEKLGGDVQQHAEILLTG